jgi:DNA-binding NarL/FixJ family response regulator
MTNPTAEPPSKRRVLLVDDHPLMREGLALLINLQADLVVCGEAGTVSAGGSEVDRLQPDLLILDLKIDAADTFEFIKSLRARYSGLRILVLSQYDEALFAERSLRAGADGYVTKQEATNEILAAARMVLEGEVYMSRKIASLVFRRELSSTPRADPPVIGSLSDRELHVFQLLGEGIGTRRISEALHLSVKTIETYQKNIKLKLGLDDAAALVRAATEWVRTMEPGGAGVSGPSSGL